MIVYVIKRDDGKYYSRNKNYNYRLQYPCKGCWTNNIFNAMVYKQEPITTYQVVPVTIQEGDVDKQIAELKAEKEKVEEQLKRSNSMLNRKEMRCDNKTKEICKLYNEQENLKQQLKEKDLEIGEWKEKWLKSEKENLSYHKENEQLKQSQNQKAVEFGQKIKKFIETNPTAWELHSTLSNGKPFDGDEKILEGYDMCMNDLQIIIDQLIKGLEE